MPIQLQSRHRLLLQSHLPLTPAVVIAYFLSVFSHRRGTIKTHQDCCAHPSTDRLLARKITTRWLSRSIYAKAAAEVITPTNTATTAAILLLDDC